MCDSSLRPFARRLGRSAAANPASPGSSPVALATFLQILRPQTLHEQRAKRLYHAQVQHMADRVRAIFDTWGTLREVQPDNARLANAAAVNRWGLMRMAREV